jgi:hypothetical protein
MIDILMTYSQQQLIAQIETGKRVKFLFFWGHQPPADGTVAEDPANWRGQNLLGFALMEVRDELGKHLDSI